MVDEPYEKTPLEKKRTQKTVAEVRDIVNRQMRAVNTVHIREDRFTMRVWRSHWAGDQFELVHLDDWPSMSASLRSLGFAIEDHTGSDD